jgi:predicted anti-sigma-YlaC factor YlaD
MKHLSLEQLNRYLDDDLDSTESATVAAHLASCEACQRELEALHRLFAELESVPSVPLPADLSAQVVQQLAPSAPRWSWRAWVAALVQLGIGLAVLLWLAPPLFTRWFGASQLSFTWLTAFADAIVRWPTEWYMQLEQLLQAGQTMVGAFEPGPFAAFTTTQLAGLLIIVGVGWALGMWLLLPAAVRAGNTEVSQ